MSPPPPLQRGIPWQGAHNFGLTGIHGANHQKIHVSCRPSSVHALCETGCDLVHHDLQARLLRKTVQKLRLCKTYTNTTQNGNRAQSMSMIPTGASASASSFSHFVPCRVLLVGKSSNRVWHLMQQNPLHRSSSGLLWERNEHMWLAHLWKPGMKSSTSSTIEHTCGFFTYAAGVVAGGVVAGRVLPAPRPARAVARMQRSL